ncbi:DEAD/DEAH box helicase [Lysinibacillus xylanilyticus]|uniref:DEAD/DEAH box helicase n=1 Tax=Lysinibacillus xylanilyticus TaxID=582475 RepID=UPI002B244CAF|nr:DEAD/DEAH box helicase [Lysinibacillus xylanilyticus]MEB2282593.1 DEAD/DEAH box helicase [Lysinibacillus xylanilyticus]
MSFLNELANKALKDPYLESLIYKLEKFYGYHFINSFCNESLNEKEYSDLLRFGDILCRSKNTEARNLSYKIISLLYNFYKGDKFFKLHAATVMVKLGNFPSLQLAVNSEQINLDEVKIESIIKETYQIAPGSNNIFTDAQYKVFEELKDSNHFSFSGPTSFGKSFIIESFIKYLIKERNASDNIVILVPTRALINQVTKKLKQEIVEPKYKILSHPTVPLLYKNKGYKYIFVFTPERLISYLSNDNPAINYVFVDEAQKLISENDSRAPLFYHALMLAKRKSVNLYFSSPNIINSDIFLQLFGNSVEETLSVTENSVAQNRFFIDCIDKKAIMFTENGKEIALPYKKYFANEHVNLKNAIMTLGKGVQNIIYCNTVDDTINYALKFADNLDDKIDPRLSSLIELVESTMHEEYYLNDCLQKGIAFHFGGLPQRIREKIEFLFREKVIDNIFCTSTLLEGVNLPAKNIFILSNAIGLKSFSDVDFWNLAGRAGRLTKDLSGNIICLRVINKKNRWNKPDKDLNVVRVKEISKVESILMTNKAKFYTNIGKSIEGKHFTRKNISDNEKKMLDSYANILAYHSLTKTDSILRSKFIDYNQEGTSILHKLDSNIEVPKEILAQSTNIKLIYQNNILTLGKMLPKVPEEVDYKSCLAMLNILYDYYNWKGEESGGRKPLVKDDKSILTYYAVLMNSWINSKPLNVIIKDVIKYYTSNRRVIFLSSDQAVLFNPKNRFHINKLVNTIVSDIENVLRFRIKNYVSNYILLRSEIEDDSSVADWSEYLEYGTTDKIIIELQNLGFPRHLATLLKNKYIHFFIIENNIITDFNEEKLKNAFDKEKYNEEFIELLEILD